jgi:ABC-type sugar transport system ATPase subunit
LDISDSLVILRNGKRVPEHIAPVADRLNDVIAAMLGETPKSIAERLQKSDGENDAGGPIAPIKVGPLRIVGLKGPRRLVIDKLEIYPGAIVGVAGLRGGRCRGTICGAVRISEADIRTDNTADWRAIAGQRRQGRQSRNCV